MINEKKSVGLISLISLQIFTLFPEYFISISTIYLLTVTFIIIYSVYSLILQRAVSESIILILFMACYLLINDDITSLNCLTFNNSVMNDYLSVFTKLIICFSVTVYFLIVGNELKFYKITSFEYLLIILFSVLGLMLLCSSNDFLTAYLSIELFSLSCYVLAAFKKTSNYSVEGGIKYFITGAISSAFFLFGTSYIYGISGTVNFTDLNDLFCLSVNQYESFDNNLLELGLVFVLFSLFIKLSLAPFHLWSLDVYEGSPTSSAFFFAVLTKLSIFVLLARLCYLGLSNFNDEWQFYCIWIGLLSIFVGSFGGLRQRKLKTLLAYSSTSHMGYTLVAFGTYTFEGLQMFIFYLIIYLISSISIWSILIILRPNTKVLRQKQNKELGDFVLLKNSNIVLVFAFALAMFSIAGIPPMVGFLAKIGIFFTLIGTSYYTIAIFSVLFSIISTFYYIRVIKVLYFENTLVGKLYHPITTKKVWIVGFFLFLLIFLFLYPTILYLNSYKTVLSFF
jgi:NADH-quinone oxidoreductase subunit N